METELYCDASGSEPVVKEPVGWKGLLANKKALGYATFASLGGVLYVSFGSRRRHKAIVKPDTVHVMDHIRDTIKECLLKFRSCMSFDRDIAKFLEIPPWTIQTLTMSKRVS